MSVCRSHSIHHESQDRLVGPAGADRRKRKRGGHAADDNAAVKFPIGMPVPP